MSFSMPDASAAAVTGKLAKTADLKSAINANTTGIDAELVLLLEAASAIAESVAGVVVGGLRRQADIIEYPRARSNHSQIIGLSCRPLESISSIKLLYGPATSDEFSEQTALVADDDYYINSAEMGTIGLINDYWYDQERSNLIIYTAGFADPDDPGSSGGEQLLPPDDLQRGVIEQAVMLWNQRKTAGLKGVEAGGASGQFGDAKIHPRLYQAAIRYRRIEL